MGSSLKEGGLCIGWLCLFLFYGLLVNGFDGVCRWAFDSLFVMFTGVGASA
jgi:hypothetical protein